MQPDNDLHLPLLHLSHTPPKWMKNRGEDREEEGTGGGSMRRCGCVQHLLAVPPSNKSTPHITDIACTRMSLCFLCSVVQNPLTPPRVSSFPLRTLSITWQFMRSTTISTTMSLCLCNLSFLIHEYINFV